jgi:hypothetical protein
MNLLILIGTLGDNDWKIAIPIIIAVFVFTANIIYQAWVKRSSAQERLGNEIISICDRMLRVLYETEQNALATKLYTETLKIAKDERTHKLFEMNFFYYLKQTNELLREYGQLKSDLIKTVRDLNDYWKSDREKELILKVMNRILFINARQFSESFKDVSPKTIENLDKECNKIKKGIAEYVFIEKIGFHISYMQRLIDSKFPLMYTRHPEQVTKLLEKLKNYNKYVD